MAKKIKEFEHFVNYKNGDRFKLQKSVTGFWFVTAEGGGAVWNFSSLTEARKGLKAVGAKVEKVEVKDDY